MLDALRHGRRKDTTGLRRTLRARTDARVDSGSLRTLLALLGLMVLFIVVTILGVEEFFHALGP